MKAKKSRRILTRAAAVLATVAAALLIVFLLGRYGWKLGGFRACQGAGIDSVEVTENAVHMTGAALFLLPYVLAVSTGIVYSWTVCIIALAASAEELTIHFCQKEYRADIKSIFQRERKIR